MDKVLELVGGPDEVPQSRFALEVDEEVNQATQQALRDEMERQPSRFVRCGKRSFIG